MSEQKKKKIAIALAKCHLDTVMSDYVVFGFNRYQEPIDLQEEINVLTKEALVELYSQTLIRLQALANLSNE